MAVASVEGEVASARQSLSSEVTSNQGAGAEQVALYRKHTKGCKPPSRSWCLRLVILAMMWPRAGGPQIQAPAWTAQQPPGRSVEGELSYLFHLLGVYGRGTVTI